MAFKVSGTLRDSGSSPRTGNRIKYLIVHHAATTNRAGFFATLEGTSREVTANFAIAGGKTYRQVSEGRRAWTSGAWSIDDQALTVETLNSTGAPHWRISDQNYDQLAELALYMHDEYEMPLDRDHIIGHGELLPRFGVSYATACPGGINIDQIIKLAKTKKAGGLTVADIDELKQLIKKESDRVYEHISHQARVTRGSAQLGWIKTNLWKLVHENKPIDLDIDVKELAAELREAFGDDLAAEVAPLLTVTTKGK